MSSDYPTILPAGGDPDLLLVRSAMLASDGTGGCGFVMPYGRHLLHTRGKRAKRLTNVLLGRHKAVKVLQIAAGDDCCAAGFLGKVEEALHESSLTSHPVLEATQAN